MADPVTHILIPMFIVETYRRYFARKRFSRWYVFAAGFIGAAPDFDFIYSWIVTGRFEMSYHRTLTHSMFLPLALLALGAVIYMLYSRKILKYEVWQASYTLLFAGSVGLIAHVLLDGIDGLSQWFYPLTWSVNLPNLILTHTRAVMIDGALLLLWLLYDEELLNDLLCIFGFKN